MRRILAAVSFLALALFAAAPAHAAAGRVVTGWGTRGAFTLAGEVRIQPDGTVSGAFSILQDLDATQHQACRYRSFSHGSVRGATATFWGTGICHGPAGSVTTSVRM